MRRYLLPRLRDFIFVVVLLSALVVGARMLNTDSDLGRHLTVGRYILDTGRIPTQDLLSFTKAGAPRPPYEWLAQVLLALAYRLLGLDGVVALTCLVIALAFTFVYSDSVHRSGMPMLALFLTAWAAVASSLHWLARPHIFSFVFFALWVAWLERMRRGERIFVWLFPALMLLWSNTHGAFIFGFLAWVAYLAGWCLDFMHKQADRSLGVKFLFVGLTSAIASILTPDLWRNWEAVLSNRSSYVLSRTVETMPLQLASPGVWPFLAMLAATVIIILLPRRRVPVAPVFLLAGLAMLSIAMVRNIPFFVIAAAPFLSEQVARTLSPVGYWQRLEARLVEVDANLKGFATSALAVIVALGFFAFRDVRLQNPVYGFSSAIFPVEAASWVQAHPQPAGMFNDFNWGGYLLYRLWPQQKVFIDSQSDFYGEDLTRQAAEVSAGSPGWQAVLDEHTVNWMLLPVEAGLADAWR